MAVKIVTPADPAKATGVPRYWRRMIAALESLGLVVEWVPVREWAKGGQADPEADVIVVDNQDALLIEQPFVTIAVQHGCAMAHGLRVGSQGLIEMGRRQARAAQRKRTYWVGCSNWAAHHCHRYMGVQADRVIVPGVDTDAFFPSARQISKKPSRPVVLHHCADKNKGVELIGAVEERLGGDFDVVRLSCKPEDVPDAMRGADLWLCLSASEGAPTVVMEAMATNLVVVAPDVGVLWEYGIEPCAERIPARDDIASYSPTTQCAVYPWMHRTDAEYVAALVRTCWQHRDRFHPRQYALDWFNLGIFGQRWVLAIEDAMLRFGLKSEKKEKPGAPPAARLAPRKKPRFHSKPGPVVHAPNPRMDRLGGR